MTIAIVCYCPRCDYFLKTAVQEGAVGSHWCIQCEGSMEVYIAQGAREVVDWHDVAVQRGLMPATGEPNEYHTPEGKSSHHRDWCKHLGCAAPLVTPSESETK